MLSFLSGLANLITGDIKAIVKWITKALAAVYSYLDKEFTAAWNEAVQAANYALELYRSAIAFAQSILTYAQYIVTVTIPGIIHWASNALDTLTKYAQDVYNWAAKQVDQLAHVIASGLDDLRSWVVSNIYRPLYDSLSGALHWIAHEGSTAYTLVTHPDKLASILAEYVWSQWAVLMKRYGRQIGRWLIADLVHLAGPLIDVLEEIIAGIL